MRDDGASLTVDEQPMNQQNAIFDTCSNVAEQVFGNYGWKVGAIVALRKLDPKTPKADVQLEIGFVNDDGSIGLHPILADGSVDKVHIII